MLCGKLGQNARFAEDLDPVPARPRGRRSRNPRSRAPGLHRRYLENAHMANQSKVRSGLIRRGPSEHTDPTVTISFVRKRSARSVKLLVLAPSQAPPRVGLEIQDPFCRITLVESADKLPSNPDAGGPINRTRAPINNNSAARRWHTRQKDIDSSSCRATNNSRAGVQPPPR